MTREDFLLLVVTMVFVAWIISYVIGKIDDKIMGDIEDDAG